MSSPSTRDVKPLTVPPSGMQRHPSAWTAVRTGIGVGAATLGVYLVAGFVVAGWSLGEFLTQLTPSILGWLVLAGAIAVTVVAVPVVGYLRFRVVSPLVVLCAAVVGWTGLGVAQGIPLPDLFGLSYYAFALSPVYLLCYVVFGAVEYRLRN